jgi:NAD(P)-dependent dehydrogenase (short-subunit alcohol dehydrogenase family)
MRLKGKTALVTGAGGGIDILVNNAGIMSPAPFLEISFSDFCRVFETNVLGLFYLSRLVAKQRQPSELADHSDS